MSGNVNDNRIDGKQPGASKKKIVAAVAACLAVAAIGGGMMALRAAATDPGEGSGVVTQAVEVGDISQIVTGTGSLSADADVNVLDFIPSEASAFEGYVRALSGANRQRAEGGGSQTRI